MEPQHHAKKFHFDNLYMDNPQSFEHIMLYQVGDLSCESGYVIGEHRQICYEISYVASGEGDFFVDGVKYRVQKGDIFFNLPGELHDGRADTIDPFRYFYIGFNFTEPMSDAHPFAPVRRMFDQIRKPLLRDRLSIEAPFLNIFNELIYMTDYSSLMMQTYLDQVIVLAYRNLFDQWRKEYAPKAADPSGQLVYEAIHYIDVNLCEIRDLSEIAAQLGYSYSYLSRVFSRETGFGMQEYYNRKRFEKAAEWLRSSDFSITRIAETLQYKSIHSFSKAFRKKFGISPTQYMEICRKNNK